MATCRSILARAQARAEIPYSHFLDHVEQNKVAAVVISGDQIRGELKDGSRFATVNPETNNSAMIRALIERDVTVSGERPGMTSGPVQLLLPVLPILLLIAVCFYLWPREQKNGAGGANAMNFGKSPARRLNADEVRVTFGDVAGVDEAKQEVAELVEFPRDPERFRRLGGRIPRGVLLLEIRGAVTERGCT